MNEDPIRLLDRPDPPAHLVELLRPLAPPPIPPAIRASVGARLPRARAWRVIGPTLAVAAVVGIGVVAWSLVRTPPQPLPEPVAVVPVVEPPPAAPEPGPSTEIGQPALPPAPREPPALDAGPPSVEPAPLVATPEVEARARECTMRGDPACVIRLLEGRAQTANQLALLIEAYRARGDQQRAVRNMQAYVQRFPNTPRAMAYRQILSRHLAWDEDE